MVDQAKQEKVLIDAQPMAQNGRTRQLLKSIRARLRGDHGGVSTIAGIAILTIGVVAAAATVVTVMQSHAESVPGPDATQTGGGTGTGGN